MHIYCAYNMTQQNCVIKIFFPKVIVGLLWVIYQPCIMNIWYSVYTCHENLILRVYKLQEINILSMWAKKIWYPVYMYRENQIFCLQVWRFDFVYLLSRKSDILYTRIVRIWYFFYACHEELIFCLYKSRKYITCTYSATRERLKTSRSALTR
jgi:hypothetical protein